MKSTMRIGSHPIHPMLIPFPFAFWTGSFIADVYAGLRDYFHDVGYILAWAGCVAALIAAIPGAVDLFTSVPAGSAARRTGIRHGLLNVAALVLFAISIAARPSPGAMTYTAYATAALGVLLIGVSGWLGGSLVYDHKVGVPDE
jgi:uncharacterized membrane protein